MDTRKWVKSLVPHFCNSAAIVFVVILTAIVFWPPEPEPETPVIAGVVTPLIAQGLLPPNLEEKHLKLS